MKSARPTLTSLTCVCIFLFIAQYSFSQEYIYGLSQNSTETHQGSFYRISTEENDFSMVDRLDRPLPLSGTVGPLQLLGGTFYVINGIGKYGVKANSFGVSNPGSLYDNGTSNGTFVQGFDGKFYALTLDKGANGMGTIFKTDYAVQSGSLVVAFDGVNKGRAPKGNLITDNNSFLYGMTEFGGANDKGVIFSVNPANPATFKKLLDFDGTNGSNPVGSLVLASDGFLYGMTKSGGLNNLGAIFKMAVDGSGYTKLLDFNGASTGSTPLGSLVEFTDGKLYGTASAGGINSFGTIFSITTSGSFSKVIDFNGDNGKTPIGDLLVAPSGSVMYGTAYSGGANNYGTLFRIDNTFHFTKFYDYTGDSGNPIGILMMMRAQQEINFPSLPVKNTLSVPFNLTASSQAGTPVYFKTDDDAITIDKGVATIQHSGTATVKAFTLGNYQYLPITETPVGFVPLPAISQQVLTITKVSQTVTFDELPVGKKYGDAPFNLSATASSNLPVTFTSSNPGTVSIAGNKATINGPGVAVITAVQAGNDKYDAAASVARLITVAKGTMTITLAAPATSPCCGTINYSVSPSDAIVINTTPDLANIYTSPTQIYPKKVGTIELLAYSINPRYNVTPVTKSIVVTKAPQAISLGSFQPEYTGLDNIVYIYPTAPGGLVTTKTNPAGIVTIQDGNLFPIGFGTTTITFSQSGNDSYNPAPDISRTVTIKQPSPMPSGNKISWPFFDSNYTIDRGPINLTASASSGLPVQYRSSDTNVATIEGGVLTFLKPGTATIEASQSGNDTTPAATTLTKSITISKQAQYAPTPSLPVKIFVDDPSYLLSELSSAGLLLKYSSSNSSVVLVDQNQLRFVGEGSAVIHITQAGNDNTLSFSDSFYVDVYSRDQSIAFLPIDLPKKLTDPSFELTAVTSSDLPITFVSSDPSVASINGKLVTMKKAGTVQISAQQAGNNLYYPATTITRALTIDKGIQNVNFPAIESKKMGDVFILSASSNTSTAITFSTTTPGIVSLSGNVARIVGSGTANITANQVGNADYISAEVSRSFSALGTDGSYTLVSSVSAGGVNGTGYVFKTSSDPGTITPLTLFPVLDAPQPSNGLIKASDGRLYANTFNGQIVRLEADGSGYKTIFKYINDITGSLTYCEPFEGSDGYLYSTTISGAKFNHGAIVKVSKDGSDYKVVHNFTLTSGGEVWGGVMQGVDGKLYGVSRQGGLNKYGTFFRVNTDGTDFRVLLSLTSDTGYDPAGRPVQDADGIFYIAMSGGAYKGGGSLLSFPILVEEPLTYNGIKLINFDAAVSGNDPLSTVLIASDGKIYGNTALGGSKGVGLVYSINKDGSGFTKLHEFNSTDGANPEGRLTEGTDGKIYGTTVSGGANNKGSAFSMNKDGSGFSTLHSFSSLDGSAPLLGALTETTSGNFFSTTSAGGMGGYGVFYKITSAGNYTLLKDFTRDDRTPQLIIPSRTGDRYYGVAGASKTFTNGAIFSIKPDGSDYKAIMYVPGNMAMGGLLYSSTDHLWGVGVQAGVYLIFRMKNDGTEYQSIISFDNSTQKGSSPFKLIETNGFIYGMTKGGGTGNKGTLFRINLDGTLFTKVADIPSSSPNAVSDFTLASDGKLYGVTTETGGVFSLDLSGNYKALKSATYYTPQAIIELNSGDLAICTTQGGDGDNGEIIAVAKDGSYMRHIYNFASPGGRRPLSMIQSVDGWIYVLTDVSGKYQDGALFKIRGDGSGYTSVVDYSISLGYLPGKFFFVKSNQSFTFDPISSRKLSDGPFVPVTTTTSGAPVAFTSSDPSVAIVVNGMIKPLGIGTTTITASLPENANFYAASNTIKHDLVITKGTQTITVNMPAFGRMGDQPLTLDITASSGLPVTITSSDPAIASVVDGKLKINARGVVVINATQDGNNFFDSAPPVNTNFSVYGDGHQSITFGAIDDVTLGDDFDLQGSTSSGLAIVYSTSSSTISISGSHLTTVAAGHATVQAAQLGNDEFFPAQPATETLCVNPATPVISISGSLPKLKLSSSNPEGNQWYKSDVAINGGTSSQIDVSVDGHYTVVTTVDGCVSNVSEVMIVTTGLDENLNGAIEIYPNPAGNVIFVRSIMGSVSISMDIVNSIGIVVMTYKIQDTTEESIDIHNLPAGLYVARIKVDGKITTKKIIKN